MPNRQAYGATEDKASNIPSVGSKITKWAWSVIPLLAYVFFLWLYNDAIRHSPYYKCFCLQEQNQITFLPSSYVFTHFIFQTSWVKKSFTKIYSNTFTLYYYIVKVEI
jgi:hypothetical protein